jgi:hypothetical protein
MKLLNSSLAVEGGLSFAKNRNAQFRRHKSQTKLSIEAKSRHRAGVLAVPGKRVEKPDLRFGELINNAVRKKPPHPLVIFIDTNMPFK